MQNPRTVDLSAIMDRLARSGRRVEVLWQEPETLTFVARGRDYRSEFHVNASAEFTYMIKGTMHLHFRRPDGSEGVCVIPEGSTNYMPGGTPHSPRFPSDAFALISERGRAEEEIDAFRWYCPSCDALVHEERAHIDDYSKDYVGVAYKNFYGSEAHRTCASCGHVTPVPDELKQT